MTSKSVLIIPDTHADPGYSNNRFDYLGHLIVDLQPSVVAQMGDLFDLPSLCNYDSYKKVEFNNRRYVDDIGSGIEAMDRIWYKARKRKKKLPHRIILEGNHEHRIKRAILNNPTQLEGLMSFKDLELERYWDEIVEYDGDTPGIFDLDSTLLSHFFVTGVSGNAIGGANQATDLLTKKFRSCIQGHSHTADLAFRTVGSATGKKSKRIMGLVAGWYGDFRPSYAGQSCDLWWSGVVHLRGFEDGVFSPQFISMKELIQEYK